MNFWTKGNTIKQLALIAVLALVSTGAWGDFSCPTGTEVACLESGDKVCPSSTKCVDEGATCFDAYPCDLNGSFVCESEYDDVMNDYKQAVIEHNQLASENTGLRETRLEQKNCVINASTLEDAKRCVR